MKLRLSVWSFRRLIAELARRGQGRRESGAFLLGESTADPLSVRVAAVAFYDDLDSRALSGGIDLHAEGYARVAEICRASGLRVVADVHTHPSRFVRQSTIDATHPMVAIEGHVAMIVPNYALGGPRASDLGLHLYLGDYQWKSLFGREVGDVLHLSWVPRRVIWRHP